MNTETVTCSTEDLALLLDAAQQSGVCMLVLRTASGTAVCLKVEAPPRKPGRPKGTAKRTAANGAEALP